MLTDLTERGAEGKKQRSVAPGVSPDRGPTRSLSGTRLQPAEQRRPRPVSVFFKTVVSPVSHLLRSRCPFSLHLVWSGLGGLLVAQLTSSAGVCGPRHGSTRPIDGAQAGTTANPKMVLFPKYLFALKAKPPKLLTAPSSVALPLFLSLHKNRFPPVNTTQAL